MFNKEELMYLLSAVDNVGATNTQMARNKAFMTMKLADLIDKKDAPEAAPAEEPEKASPKKK